MSTMTADCPRCQTQKVTFDVTTSNRFGVVEDWMDLYEVPAICRDCSRMTIFIFRLSSRANQQPFRGLQSWADAIHLNNFFKIDGFISIKDVAAVQPPDHIPNDIGEIFREGASCLSLSCYNAAGAMFRLALDMTTKSLLPPEGDENGPNRAARTRLFDRLNWLFDTQRLPAALREIADCVREDGNDAAHDGTLAKADAEDLVDFLRVMLERVYTEPQRLELAKARRAARRSD